MQPPASRAVLLFSGRPPPLRLQGALRPPPAAAVCSRPSRSPPPRERRLVVCRTAQLPSSPPSPPPPRGPLRGARLLLTTLGLMLATAPGRAAALGLLGDLVARPLAARNPFFAGSAVGSELADALLAATDHDPSAATPPEALRHALELVLQVAANVLLIYTF